MPKLITVGELIDKSWGHYRDNFVDLMSISGWLLLVSILDIIALFFYPSSTKLLTGASLTGAEQFGVTFFAFTAWIIAPILSLWVFTSLVRLLRQQGKARKDVKLAMKEGWSYLLPAFLVSLLVFLVLVGGILVGVVPGFVFAWIATVTDATSMIFLANILIIAGIFAAFILNIRWSVLYMLSPYALLIDGKHSVEALKSTKKLVLGKFWHTALLLVVPKLVFAFFAVVVMGILAFLTGMVVSVIAGLNLDVQLRLISITTSVYPIVLAALMNPLMILTDLYLYLSLKEVSGGKV